LKVEKDYIDEGNFTICDCSIIRFWEV